MKVQSDIAIAAAKQFFEHCLYVVVNEASEKRNICGNCGIIAVHDVISRTKCTNCGVGWHSIVFASADTSFRAWRKLQAEYSPSGLLVIEHDSVLTKYVPTPSHTEEKWTLVK